MTRAVSTSELSLSCWAIQESTNFAYINDLSGEVNVHINSYYSSESFVFNTVVAIYTTRSQYLALILLPAFSFYSYQWAIERGSLQVITATAISRPAPEQLHNWFRRQ